MAVMVEVGIGQPHRDGRRWRRKRSHSYRVDRPDSGWQCNARYVAGTIGPQHYGSFPIELEVESPAADQLPGEIWFDVISAEHVSCQTFIAGPACDTRL